MHADGTVWENCTQTLLNEVPQQQFNTWIRPLHAVEATGSLKLLAPNQFVVNYIRQNFYGRIRDLACGLSGNPDFEVNVDVGERESAVSSVISRPVRRRGQSLPQVISRLNPNFTFDKFVEGKSNQLARAAASQVAENPGTAYNPLFIYGGVGLGKTHLMHAIGNQMLAENPSARVCYVYSERFVQDMVSGLQHNKIDEFKQLYRSLDALLIDDIQFFSGKDHSQEEFFHTFNALLEGQKQIILTCDRYPKEVDDLQERLKSRFGWGLTVAVEPPGLEHSVAILINKAEQEGWELPSEVAFFLAKRIRSNVRDLEGALRRILATARLTGASIDIDFSREALKDLLAVQERLVTIENIQKTVAEYFKIRVADLLSKGRSRSIARPRQIAMSLAKELTNHSLPEIGDAFGGRDHTTVIHACKRIKDLRAELNRVNEDYQNLLRTLTG